MNIFEHLSNTARILPDNEAVLFEGQRFSYSQLEAMSTAAADLLSRSGVQRGDRVAIMLPNVPAFIVWYYATQRIGAIAVSLNTRLTAREVVGLVADCTAKAIVGFEATLSAVQSELPKCVENQFSSNEIGDQCDGDLLAKISNPIAPVGSEPDEAAVILYTSGTTGFAKGATLSHANVRSNVHAFNHLCNMQSHDRILLAVPLFHCFGQNALLNSALNVGATLVLQRRFDPLEVKQLMKTEQITQLYGVPMMFQLLQESCEPSDMVSLNYCFSAAATLPIQTAKRWQDKFGLPVNEGYGLTETSPFASYNHRVKFVPGSIGTPIDNVEMKIVDSQTGSECPVGELGEIAIRGPNVMLGYWNRPEDTNLAVRDGWFYSGDIGRQDESGFFFIVDRVKDMISVGGQKVFPAEVERVMLDHPAIAQVAVVGIPDDVFGEKVVAFIVASESNTNQTSLAEQLKQAATKDLAGFKVPREFVFIDELPRNPSGKILKRELRDSAHKYNLVSHDSQTASQSAGTPIAMQADRDGANISTRSTVAPRLRSQLKSAYASKRKQVTNDFLIELVKALTESEEEVASETRFLDAGLDSLMIVEMSSQIQVEVGAATKIPATLLFDHPRICDLSDFLVATICDDDGRPESSTVSTASAVSISGSAKTTLPRQDDSTLHTIQEMSEEQALAELLKELEA